VCGVFESAGGVVVPAIILVCWTSAIATHRASIKFVAPNDYFTKGEVARGNLLRIVSLFEEFLLNFQNEITHELNIFVYIFKPYKYYYTQAYNDNTAYEI